MKNLYFRTSKDNSGNRYYLIVNLDDKTIKSDYNILLWSFQGEAVTVSSKKQLRTLATEFINAGFTEA